MHTCSEHVGLHNFHSGPGDGDGVSSGDDDEATGIEHVFSLTSLLNENLSVPRSCSGLYVPERIEFSLFPTVTSPESPREGQAPSRLSSKQ